MGLTTKHEAEHAVVIVGGGPTGLMLAGELALAGVDVAVVERRATQAITGSRAGGLHARTIEILDQRGVAERFLAEGKPVQVAGMFGTPLDISDFPTRHPYGLGLWQHHIERILAGWVAELPVRWYRGRDVTGMEQDPSGVDVMLADGAALRARYVVGCDGGRSVIRKAAGIAFPGWDATTSSLVAEVKVATDPQWGLHHDERGTFGFGKIEGGLVRMVVTEQSLATGEPTLHDLGTALVAAFGTDFGVHDPASLGRFTDMARQAGAYRERRVLLAGDAAHIHGPVGGQGLNIGVQDAVNLGWKLAQVIAGTSPETLLDTYHAERHPIAARVIQHNLAQTMFHRLDDRKKAVRDVLGEMLRMDEPRKRFAGLMSGLELRYELGGDHPLVGRRMPDLELETVGGPVRVYSLLHRARPVLLDLHANADLAPWADRVQRVRGAYHGAWELPVLGAVAAPAAVLIRPDGYVAWVGEPSDPSLADALARWFGPGRA